MLCSAVHVRRWGNSITGNHGCRSTRTKLLESMMATIHCMEPLGVCGNSGTDLVIDADPQSPVLHAGAAGRVCAAARADRGALPHLDAAAARGGGRAVRHPVRGM